MRFVRILLAGVAAVIVAGTIASASPHSVPQAPLEGSESPSPSATPQSDPGESTVSPSPFVSPEPDPSPSTDVSAPASELPEPVSSPSIEPTKTGSRGHAADPAETDSGSSADFAACAGLTGLPNAICRHEALLAADPGNQGLQNSLAHLQANLAKHEHHNPPDQSGENHGHSGEPHGHGGEPAGD